MRGVFLCSSFNFIYPSGEVWQQDVTLTLHKYISQSLVQGAEKSKCKTNHHCHQHHWHLLRPHKITVFLLLLPRARLEEPPHLFVSAVGWRELLPEVVPHVEHSVKGTMAQQGHILQLWVRVTAHLKKPCNNEGRFDPKSSILLSKVIPALWSISETLGKNICVCFSTGTFHLTHQTDWANASQFLC